ncbi:hypothetical protein [Mesonia sp. K4-1]|uniref:hypothetical protein n=1 Tax=Mesonia sp. K4-1 TaxID=2602760 RepID=UPI0011CA0B04|nr:hypothetical protein [Mesonia sp. K4-1]TXK73081.1 hypothetical protein FT986_13860 [Mesonia sp. K4-1]
MKNLIAFFGLLALFSCSADDDDNSSNDINEDTQENISIISYEKIMQSTIENSADNSTINFKLIFNGDLTHNKYTHYTREEIFNGVAQTQETFNHFTYQNNNVKTCFPFDNNDENQKREFYYNNDEELIGVSLGNVSRYYRITESENNNYYFEVLSTSNDDPNADILSRRILVFDEHDNVIKAGRDNDKDGIMDNENNFTYDENHNLIKIETDNGESKSFTYSNIKNTESYVLDQSYFKKIRRLQCAEVYAATIKDIEKLNHSPYITTEESESATFEIHENGYFKSKTWENEMTNPESTSQTTLTYFFE